MSPDSSSRLLIGSRSPTSRTTILDISTWNRGPCRLSTTVRHEIVTHVLGTNCYLCLRAVHSIFWSEWQDSNLRPSAPKADALPDCATLRTRLPRDLPRYSASKRQAQISGREIKNGRSVYELPTWLRHEVSSTWAARVREIRVFPSSAARSRRSTSVMAVESERSMRRTR